jgi:hypothetical protein
VLWRTVAVTVTTSIPDLKLGDWGAAVSCAVAGCGNAVAKARRRRSPRVITLLHIKLLASSVKR